MVVVPLRSLSALCNGAQWGDSAHTPTTTVHTLPGTISQKADCPGTIQLRLRVLWSFFFFLPAPTLLLLSRCAIGTCLADISVTTAHTLASQMASAFWVFISSGSAFEPAALVSRLLLHLAVSVLGSITANICFTVDVAECRSVCPQFDCIVAQDTGKLLKGRVILRAMGANYWAFQFVVALACFYFNAQFFLLIFFTFPSISWC